MRKGWPARKTWSPGNPGKTDKRPVRLALWIVVVSAAAWTVFVSMEPAAPCYVPYAASRAAKPAPVPEGISVYNGWPKKKPYVIVGLVEADSREPGYVARMADISRENGANGLILMDSRGKNSVPAKEGSFMVSGVAVRFLQDTRRLTSATGATGND